MVGDQLPAPERAAVVGARLSCSGHSRAVPEDGGGHVRGSAALLPEREQKKGDYYLKSTLLDVPGRRVSAQRVAIFNDPSSSCSVCSGIGSSRFSLAILR